MIARRRIARAVQLLLCVHRVHNIYNGYGWMIPMVRLTMWDGFDGKPHWGFAGRSTTHNCTWSGVY